MIFGTFSVFGVEAPIINLAEQMHLSTGQIVAESTNNFFWCFEALFDYIYLHNAYPQYLLPPLLLFSPSLSFASFLITMNNFWYFSTPKFEQWFEDS